MHKTAAEIKQLSSREITYWTAFFQVRDWLRKAEADTPEKAWEFARAVNDIFEERAMIERS